ncbi:hypothetical protein [Sulfoacidibacillus ferrooxidans]|uniref:hypothetical protein n=1 Tax=Sulfoacidibacillus ferrooxidans TaxID=2005001 RepID=UPI003AFB366C
MEHLLATENDATRFIVSTGQKNTPAVKLYEQYGFTETDTTEISSGVYVAHFERKAV